MKVFSKKLWLKSAMQDKKNGILTQREIDDALEIWVNLLDGKTEDELQEMNAGLDPRWLEEVEETQPTEEEPTSLDGKTAEETLDKLLS